MDKAWTVLRISDCYRNHICQLNKVELPNLLNLFKLLDHYKMNRGF